MHFLNSILAASALVASAVAVPSVPLAYRQTESYYLQVSSNDTRFDGMYLSSYHTGAGSADVVLSTDATYFTTNGTEIHANIYPSSEYTGLLFSDAEGDTYDDWYSVVLDVDQATDGFSFSSGVLTNSASYFESWLVCEWAHNSIPQLFYLVLESPTIPDSCAIVDIVLSISN